MNHDPFSDRLWDVEASASEMVNQGDYSHPSASVSLWKNGAVVIMVDSGYDGYESVQTTQFNAHKDRAALEQLRDALTKALEETENG